jgi:hypothetical protein
MTRSTLGKCCSAAVEISLTEPSNRYQIRDGDLFLFRRSTWLGRVISGCGRSEYSHAGMCVWRDFGDKSGYTIWVIESIWPRVRRVPLVNYVDRYPGLIDWYEAAPPTWTIQEHWYSRPTATDAMLGLVGRRYGLWNLLRVACRHVPGLRLVAPILSDDSPEGPGLFCSQAVSWACRQGGVDLVPHLSDRLTEPADLCRSLLFQFRGTLVP